MNTSIKKCTIQDFDTLRQLSIKTYYETFALLNNAEDMAAYLEEAFNENKLHRELCDENSSFFFLYADERLAGYLKLNEAPSQTDMNDSESLEIERIYVSKEFQGTGLGKYLMEQAISIATERGKKYAWLGVWEKNEKAIRFYKKNGFYEIGTHQFVMGEDVQTDYIMRKNLEQYRIVPLTSDNIADLNRSNEPFDIIGRLKITFVNGEWHCEEALSDTITKKQYPNYDGAEAEDYITSADRIAYLAYDGERCIGQILLAKSWNEYAHIEDISVAADYRGKGIGTSLLSQAKKWAREQGLSALSLECQDNNILASRFYKKNGFRIGGVNTDLYRLLGKPYEDEVAVFWYY